MREIAYTTLGRNALSTGLVSHFSALLAGMMPVSGAQTFFYAAYGFACLAFAVGAYAELKHRGLKPLLTLSFYAAAALPVVPFIGPIAALLMLYAVQGEKQAGPFLVGGLLLSIPRLKLNPLVLFIFMTILFILFALSILEGDSFFKKMREGRASLHEQQVERVYCRDGYVLDRPGLLASLPGKNHAPETAMHV